MTIPLPDDPAFARRVEQCEVDAWLQLDQSVPGGRQLTFYGTDSAILLLDQATNWPHSRILNLGIEKPASPETIRALLDAVRSAGIETLMTDVSPIARPGNIPRLLREAGFNQTERHVVVARSTQGMPEPDGYFRIRLGTEDDRDTMFELMNEVIEGAPDWCALLAGQVSRPDWRYYIALEDGKACGLAGMHLSDDMAWLSPIWVKTPYRNRGTQAALIAYAVRDGAANGAQWVVTSYPASIPGRTRNFQRAGFSIVYLRNRFVWKETAS